MWQAETHDWAAEMYRASRASIRLRRSRGLVWAGGLPLHKVADHLLAVAARAPVADVDPAGLAAGCGLPDELVKREVVHHPGKPLAARLDVRDKNVGSAAARVVRGLHAPYGDVEPWRAVAAVDADGVAEVGPQRFQDVEAELLEVADGRDGRRVVYAPCDGDEGGGKLREAEVF